MIMETYANHVIVVFCYIIKNKNLVLLTRRKLPPNQFESTVVGGKKEQGEDLVGACKREVKEETNLELSSVKLRGIVNVSHKNKPYEVVSVYFESRDLRGDLKESQEGEVFWASIEDSDKLPSISEFYLRISPYVYEQDEIFMGRISVDERGKIEHCQIKAERDVDNECSINS